LKVIKRSDNISPFAEDIFYISFDVEFIKQRLGAISYWSPEGYIKRLKSPK